jgi:DNA polymerase elongation subunit (family B)
VTRLFLDIEVYRNYFLALIMNEEGRTKRFEMFDDESNFDPEELLAVIKAKDVELVTFNGNTYDIPVLTFAMVNPDTSAIKDVSDEIIGRNIKPWVFYKNHGLREPKLNHIDLIDVAPGQHSLKIYGGRLHSPRLQELPIPHDALITPEQVSLLRSYCKNDLKVTQMLYKALEGQVDLRRTMSQTYGVDLRSKSDAKIAEEVLKAEFERRTGETPPKTKPDYSRFRYEPPKYIRFATETLRETLNTICTSDMELDSKTGHVILPPEIEKMVITIGNSRYKIGIGGLHSQETSVAHFSDEENVLIDRDVESYYPRMMLNMQMEPGGFGSHFNPVYGGILEDRLTAKHAGDMVKSNSLKIVLNGTFGKTSNRYSTLYSPDFMIRTTITGQLTILMLIEALELYGVPVVSANTDGILIKCPRALRDDVNAIIAAWEKRTNLKTEETVYKAIYSRDVNNYIAIKEDGKVKAKGAFGPPSLAKSPQNMICNEAVIAYLTRGLSIQGTVCSCRDITKFLTLRTVNGGAVKDGVEIGRAIRWYYSVQETSAIHYVTNNNMVPRSEGARPVMDLPEVFPLDLNFQWYIAEAESILMDIGAVPRPVTEKLPRKNSKAWVELRDTGKIVENHKGVWVWAAA